MGGSGGNLPSFSDVKKMLEDQNSDVREQYNSKVNQLLVSELSTYERNATLINDYLDEILEILSEDFEESLDLRFGGSVSKHTYVDGLSDVDSLVIINNCELSDSTPEKALKYFEQKLKSYFPSHEVTKGRLAVTIKRGDIEIQLLPAIKCKVNLKISNYNGKDWSLIKPKEFANALTRVNEKCGYRVVPIIKLVKSIIDQYPEKQKISGYHIESLAIDIFKNYEGKNSRKEMLTYFFKHAPSKVLSPIKDKSGQSIHVDDYLDEENSFKRRWVSDALNRTLRKIEYADLHNFFDEWKSILGII